MAITSSLIGVVSLDLNADQYVLSLVKPAHIHGVTSLAANARYSYYASHAQGVRVQKGGFEALLDPRIRVVVATGPLSVLMRGQLKRAGIPVILLKGSPVLKDIDHDFDRVRRALFQYAPLRSVACPPYTCVPPARLGVVYGQGGISPGSTSHLSQALTCAGYQSPLPQLPGWHTLSTERLMRDTSTTLFVLDAYKIPPALATHRCVFLPLPLTLSSHPLIVRALIQFMRNGGGAHV